jgi:cobyrinic acid a,c-diamide synthase
VDIAQTRIAIARGPAFSFHYEENLELLRGAGAQLLPFDPLIDEALPDAPNDCGGAGGQRGRQDRCRAA